MTEKEPYHIRDIHPDVEKYLRKRPEIKHDFADALESIEACPFSFQNPGHVRHLRGPYHCNYRYVLKTGRRGVRFTYRVDTEHRAIDIYSLRPRGAVY
jgi:mRNA-degrading endonuclease RelE of RelBE toxin-antitoxin system